MRQEGQAWAARCWRARGCREGERGTGNWKVALKGGPRGNLCCLQYCSQHPWSLVVAWKRTEFLCLSPSFFVPPAPYSLMGTELAQVTALLSMKLTLLKPHILLPAFPFPSWGSPTAVTGLISVQSLLFIPTWPGSWLPLGYHIQTSVPSSRNAHPFTHFLSELTQKSLP